MEQMYFYLLLGLFYIIPIFGLFFSEWYKQLIICSIGLIGLGFCVYFIPMVSYTANNQYVEDYLTNSKMLYYRYGLFGLFTLSTLRVLLTIKSEYL